MFLYLALNEAAAGWGYPPYASWLKTHQGKLLLKQNSTDDERHEGVP